MAKAQVLNEAGNDHNEPEMDVVEEDPKPKTSSARIRAQKYGNPRKKWKQKKP